jgi:hypothetical protein
LGLSIKLGRQTRDQLSCVAVCFNTGFNWGDSPNKVLTGQVKKVVVEDLWRWALPGLEEWLD